MAKLAKRKALKMPHIRNIVGSNPINSIDMINDDNKRIVDSLMDMVNRRLPSYLPPYDKAVVYSAANAIERMEKRYAELMTVLEDMSIVEEVEARTRLMRMPADSKAING